MQRIRGIFAAVVLVALLSGGCSFFLPPMITVTGSEGLTTQQLRDSNGSFMSGGSFGGGESVDRIRFPVTYEFGLRDGWVITRVFVDGTEQQSYTPGSDAFVLSVDMLAADSTDHFVFVLAVPLLESNAENRLPHGSSYSTVQVTNDGINHLNSFDLLSGNGQSPPVELYTDDKTITSFSVVSSSGYIAVAFDDPGDSSVPHKIRILPYGKTTTTRIIDNMFDPVLLPEGSIIFRNSIGQLFIEDIYSGADQQEILAAPNTSFYRPVIIGHNNVSILAVYRDVPGDGLYADMYSYEFSYSPKQFLPVLLKSVQIGEHGDTPLPIVWDPTDTFATFAVKSAVSDVYSTKTLTPYAFPEQIGGNDWWGNFVDPNADLGLNAVALSTAMQDWNPYETSVANPSKLSDDKPYLWFPATTNTYY